MANLINNLKMASYEKDNKIYSIGGRVLNITSVSETLTEARDKSLVNIFYTLEAGMLLA